MPLAPVVILYTQQFHDSIRPDDLHDMKPMSASAGVIFASVPAGYPKAFVELLAVYFPRLARGMKAELGERLIEDDGLVDGGHT